jgi:hypothetical protein
MQQIYKNEILNPSLRLCDPDIIDIFVKNKPRNINIEDIQTYGIQNFMNPEKKLKDHEVQNRINDNKYNNEDKYHPSEYEQQTLNQINNELESDNDIRSHKSDNDRYNDRYNDRNDRDDRDDRNDRDDRDDRNDRDDRDDRDDRNDRNDRNDRYKDHNYEDYDRDKNKERNYEDDLTSEERYKHRVKKENDDKAIRSKKRDIFREFSILEQHDIHTSLRYSMEHSLQELDDELDMLKDKKACQMFITKTSSIILISVLLLELLLCKIGFVNIKGWFKEVKDTIDDYKSDMIELYGKYKNTVSWGPEISIIGGLLISGISHSLLKSNIPKNVMNEFGIDGNSVPSGSDNGGLGGLGMMGDLMGLFGGLKGNTSKAPVYQENTNNVIENLMKNIQKKQDNL